MKPFDLEKAKQGGAVVTRNGRKARILSFDIDNLKYPIAAVWRSEEGNEIIESYTLDGKIRTDEVTTGYDLLMLE